MPPIWSEIWGARLKAQGARLKAKALTGTRQRPGRGRRRERVTGPTSRRPDLRNALAGVLMFRQTNILGTLLLLFLTTLPMGSCARVNYILHAAAGQFRLMSSAVPVEKGVESASLTADQKDRLRLVARIKAFGEHDLGLKETENYQTVSLKSGKPLYVVSASHKDRLKSLTWWFPIVGAMPYLGFFDREKAGAEAARLRGKDLDVMVGSADAYSTLGWFEDPVTLNLLQGSTPELVEIILHEMTHTTLYIKGQGAFNEGLANLVGKIGALNFLKRTYGPLHPFTIEAENIIQDERLFSFFIADLLKRLEKLYTSPLNYSKKLDRREAIFRAAKTEFNDLETALKTSRFIGFGRGSLNNAYLLSIGLYHRHFNLFEGLFQKKGRSLMGTILYCKGLAEKEGGMIEKMGMNKS